MSVKYQLVVRSGVNAGTVFPLEEEAVTIGRETGNQITIPDPEVSRKHARLVFKGETYLIEDLGSTNGTFVDEQRIVQPMPLHPGAFIAFGDQVILVYEFAEDPNATMLSASARAVSDVTEETPPPVRRAQPAPVPAPIRQAPSFSGKVPDSAPPPEAERANSTRMMFIAGGIILLCSFLSCMLFLVWVDLDPTGSRWCQFFPWLVQMLGGFCG